MFIVQEIQTAADGTVTMLPPIMRDDPQQAESEFHLKLCYAAISELPAHAVIILDETGALKKRECYFHYTPGGNEPGGNPE